MSDGGASTLPDTRPAVAPGAARPRRPYGLMAEFRTPGELLEAAKTVRDTGYRWWDCHSPFPVHGLDEAMGIRPTILPWIALIAGLIGCGAGLFLQWFTNAVRFDLWLLVWVRGYEFYISGKPLASLPIYVPVTFELTILLSATGAFLGMLLLNGLPRLYHPVFRSERFARATDDRFFLVIEARDPKFDRSETEALLESLNPAGVEELED